ncbi:hypothetical protein [Pseudoalteromonas sp. SK20]|uniref:hypothetical protein n=1 Tax=Pseudoalteromonas sp. SK20 TaxID=1938367 RepID=UPI000977951E|nr:hypothetical protein [Pseudoalteromonas sp. SK20]
MAAFTADQASVTNGSKVVTINSGESIENINPRDFLVLNNQIVEITRGYISSDGQQCIELLKSWAYGNQNNQPCIVIPTTGNFAAAIQSLKDAQALVNENFATMQDWQTKTGTVTFTHPDGTQTTVQTLPEALSVRRKIATLEQMYEGNNNETLVTPFNFKKAFNHYRDLSGFSDVSFSGLHNDLEGRKHEGAHPADAIDWSDYNITPEDIALKVNEGSPTADEVDWTDYGITPQEIAEKVTESGSDLGSVLSVSNVEALKNMKLINGETVLLETDDEVHIRTQSFSNVFDNGGGFYRCLSLSKERQNRQDPTWVPTNYDSFYLYNGTTYVAVLIPDKELYLETFGIFPTLSDCLEGFNLILEYEKPVRTVQSGVRFDLSDTIYKINKSIDIDLNKCTLNSIGENERCFLAVNNLYSPMQISDCTYSRGRTTFTVPKGHGINADDKIKSFSNQNINPFSEFDRQRTAEYFVVESVTDTAIVCIGKHIWDYSKTYNPRLAKMRTEKTCRIRNMSVGRELPHNGDFAVAIDVQGYFKPDIQNAYSPNFPGQLLSVRSCYRARMENISADFLLDDTSTMAVGYVGADYGSQESEWYGLNGGKVRHTYTTGADSINADEPEPRRYGGAVRCHVYTGVTVGATNFAYDTHQDAWECEFHDITVYDDYSNTYASAGAFQDRSQNNIVHKLTHISDGSDVSAGQRTVMYNTGARNTYIKEIIYKGVGGAIISSFGLADSFTSEKHHFRIDKIRVYQEKAAPAICQLSEKIGVDIGIVDVYPWDATRTFYGSGGDTYFKISDANADLNVHEMNLWFDRINLPPIASAGAYLVNVTDTAGNIKINLNTYTNANTFQRFEGALSGIRATESAGIKATVKSCILHHKAYVAGFDPVTMSKTGIIFKADEIRGLVTDDDLKYTYNLIADGVNVTGTSKTTPRGIFEADMHLSCFDIGQYGLRESTGIQIDPHKELTVTGQSASSSISSVDKPAFAGQTANLTNLGWNITPNITEIILKAGANNTDIIVDRPLRVGESINLIAYEKADHLVWAVPRIY